MEALARALPPSLMALSLGGMYGWGLFATASGLWCDLRGAEFPSGGGSRIASERASAQNGAWRRIRGSDARGLQATKSEMRAWRRLPAHCRRVRQRSISTVRAAGACSLPLPVWACAAVRVARGSEPPTRGQRIALEVSTARARGVVEVRLLAA